MLLESCPSESMVLRVDRTSSRCVELCLSSLVFPSHGHGKQCWWQNKAGQGVDQLISPFQLNCEHRNVHHLSRCPIRPLPPSSHACCKCLDRPHDFLLLLHSWLDIDRHPNPQLQRLLALLVHKTISSHSMVLSNLTWRSECL